MSRIFMSRIFSRPISVRVGLEHRHCEEKGRQSQILCRLPQAERTNGKGQLSFTPNR